MHELRVAGFRLAAGDRLLVLGASEALPRSLRDVGARVDVVSPRLADENGIEVGTGYDGVVCIDAFAWMRNLDGALDALRRALVVGGRLLAETEHASPDGALSRVVREALLRRRIEPDDACPWLSLTPARFRERVSARGFAIESFRTVAVRAPANLLGALSIAASTSMAVPPGARAALLNELGHAFRALIEPRTQPRDLGVCRSTCLAVAR